MWIDVMDTMCRVTLAEDDELAWLQRYLSFEDVKFRGRARGRRVSMFSTRTSMFPGGLLKLVREAAVRDGISIEERDRRSTRIVPDPSADLRWLRDYQREAVEACVAAKRGIVRAPTGCLTGDTTITVNRFGEGFKIRLDTLVSRLAGEVGLNSRGRQCSWDLSTPTTSQSVIDGFIRKNGIVRGWRNGLAQVYRLTTIDNHVIRATADHRFMLPDGEFSSLGNLTVHSAIISSAEHRAEHGRDGWKHVTPRAVETRVASIEPDGIEETYDLEMEAPHNNYVANGLVVHNSGKGDMIVGLVRRLPGRWLFLVHRDSLVDQQAKRYRKITGRSAQELSRTPARSWNLIDGFNLITLQSLAAGLRSDPEAVHVALSRLDALVIDEAHVAPADVYYDAIQRCSAEYRFGFSGTPLDRTDNRSLMAIAALGPIIYSIKATTLIEAGVLAAPQITMVTCRQTPPAVKGGPTMRQQAAAAKRVYDSLVVESAERNSAVVRAVQEAAKPCMVFVKIVDHGTTLMRMLRSAGIETEFVFGLKTKEQRLAAVERLERGDSQALVASVVFQEGIDIPSLASVVVASGGKSVIAALQRIGRGMRTDGGRKMVFSVFDVLDLGSGTLERHARRRMNTYVREGYQTIIRADDGSTKAYAPRLMTRGQKREAMP